jgi:hypothetical protein
MSRKYFYFDYDYYGMSFCEEEITTEPEEKVAYTSNSGGFADEVTGIPKEGHQSSIGEHSCVMPNTQDTGREEPEETSKVAETSEQSLFRIPRKAYRFTPGQLWELQAVFVENQYPDALKRCVFRVCPSGSFSSPLTPFHSC